MLVNSKLNITEVDGKKSDGCGSPIPQQPDNGHSGRFYVEVEDPNMGILQREYLIHIPTYYERSNDVPVSLVVDYHGWTSNAGMSNTRKIRCIQTKLFYHLNHYYLYTD